MMPSVIAPPPAVAEKINECSSLPRGWRRKEMLRQSGISSAKVEVCYISPSGRVFNNKAALQRYLGSTWDLTGFDWQSGRVLGRALHQSTKNNDGSVLNLSQHVNNVSRPQQPINRQAGINRNQMCLGSSNSGSTTIRPQIPKVSSTVGPVRQTASIFKQPVTLVTSSSRQTKPTPSNELTKQNGKSTSKPRQVLWPRRVAGLHAYLPDLEDIDIDDDDLPAVTSSVAPDGMLPARLVPCGLGIDESAALASLCWALQQQGSGVTGQSATASPRKFQDPIALDCRQPLVTPQNNIASHVSEAEVLLQERRVQDARRRLEQARTQFAVAIAQSV